jgi:[acyl-carrier-protein] S-malonyltransferase
MKFAILFPGQGSQEVGMGKALALKFPQAAEIYVKADSILGFSISKYCWEGPEEELGQTRITQPAIVVTSLACYEVFKGLGLSPAAAAGHSIGEYAALAAAGVLSFEDTMKLVKLRGELMQNAGDTAPGTMAAVIGMPFGQVEEICRQAQSEGVVELANINTPEQVVISGSLKGVEKACEFLKAAGAKRVLPLKVSAAFHSPLMEPAALKFAEAIDKFEFKDAEFPVVMNTTAKFYTSGLEIKETLKKQLRSKVFWVASLQNMEAAGISTFLELGKGTALSGMVRKTLKEAKALNIEDPASWEKTIAELGAATVV